MSSLCLTSNRKCFIKNCESEPLKEVSLFKFFSPCCMVTLQTCSHISRHRVDVLMTTLCLCVVMEAERDFTYYSILLCNIMKVIKIHSMEKNVNSRNKNNIFLITHTYTFDFICDRLTQLWTSRVCGCTSGPSQFSETSK
jgi:hypothetical protein